jgi:hypothetical protein
MSSNTFSLEAVDAGGTRITNWEDSSNDDDALGSPVRTNSKSATLSPFLLPVGEDVDEDDENEHDDYPSATMAKVRVVVRRPSPHTLSKFRPVPGENTVRRVLRTLKRKSRRDEPTYEVRFEDAHREEVSLLCLFTIEGSIKRLFFSRLFSSPTFFTLDLSNQSSTSSLSIN